MKRILAAVFAALASSCLPEPHSLIGRGCDEAHPCPGALFCVAGACQASPEGAHGDAGAPDDGGSVDLAKNGSFEAGLSDGWEPRSDSVVAVAEGQGRDGGRALLVHAAPGFNGTWGVRNENVVAAPLDAGLTYCAEAFFQRAPFSTPLEVQLLLRAYDGAGNFGADSPSNRLALPATGWIRHTAKLQPADPFTARLSVRMSTDDAPDGGYLVDDVRIWTDGSGACP